MPEYIPRHDMMLDDEEYEDGEFECIGYNCGKIVENEGDACKDCQKEAAEDDKADREREDNREDR